MIECIDGDFYINNKKINDFDVFISGVGNENYPIKIKLYGKDIPVDMMGIPFMVTRKTYRCLAGDKEIN